MNDALDSDPDLRAARPPSERELQAFTALVKLSEAGSGIIPAGAAWHVLRDFKRFRRFTRCGTSEEARADATVAAEPRVLRAADRLVARVGRYLTSSQRVQLLRDRIAVRAFSTLAEVLEDGGAYDGDAALAKAKGETALGALKATGHSLDVRTPSVAVHLAGAGPRTEQDSIRDEQKRLRDQ